MDKEIKEYTKQELGISAMSIGQLKRIRVLAKALLILILSQVLLVILFDLFLSDTLQPLMSQFFLIIIAGFIDGKLFGLGLSFLLAFLIFVYICYLLYRLSTSLKIALEMKNSNKLEYSLGDLSRITILITSSVLVGVITAFIIFFSVIKS